MSGVDDSELDPGAPPFVPDGSVPASSLVFSKGSRFLTKYDEQGVQDSTEPPKRSNGSATGGRAEPDRLNIQLNSLLIRSKSVDRILQVVDANFVHFNVVNVVTALHRMASVVIPARKAMLRRDLRFKRLINKLSDMMRLSQANAQPDSNNNLSPQDLSNISWALCKLGLVNEPLFSVLSEHIIQTIDRFEPVNLSMTLWAFARSNLISEKLFKAASPEVSKKLDSFAPQQISNTCWALAKSGFVDEALFQRAAKLSLGMMSEFKPMNFSMLVYSFALAKIPHPELFEHVSKYCTIKELSSSSSSPHVIANLVWAYAESGTQDPELFKTVAMVSSPNIFEFTQQQVITLAGAFANAGVQNERLFQSISDAVAQRLSEFKQSEIKELLRSFEKLNVSASHINRAIEAQQNENRQGGVYASLGLLGFVVLMIAFIIAMKSYNWTPDSTPGPSPPP